MRWMTWRLANIACHVTGCHLAQETRLQGALDDRDWRMLLVTSRVPNLIRRVFKVHRMTWRATSAKAYRQRQFEPARRRVLHLHLLLFAVHVVRLRHQLRQLGACTRPLFDLTWTDIVGYVGWVQKHSSDKECLD